jgi:hypothetical protein
VIISGRYGKLYFVSEMMDTNWSKLKGIAVTEGS